MIKRDQDILQKLEKDLNLKQLQIKSLLTITQAINENVPASGLFNMYKNFLSWDMEVKIMALYIKKDSRWVKAASIQFDDDIGSETVEQHLLQFQRLHTIKEDDPEFLQAFDLIIPVFHKNQAIAYSLIGGLKDKDDIYSRIQFITTITNIIAVAIENKRLFKRQIKQERLNREMELASEVQKMLIPESLPQGDGFEISSIYKPHYNVGGDFIDFIPFTEDKFAVCIADISGKGVAAALLMANFQAILHSLIYQYRDLETFVIALNQAVYRITRSDRYLTFFIGEFDLKNKQLKYINAGHYPPLLYRSGEVIPLEKGCTIIGAFDRLPEIQEGVEKLTEGSLLLTFTDGLIDLRNDTDKNYDEDLLKDFILSHHNESAAQINEHLMRELLEFAGEEAFPDDIAVLSCKITR